MRGALEFFVMLAVCFALVFGFVRPVVASPVFIDSGSMIPTIEIDDRVLINKLADDFTEPDRGDIVLFTDPDGGETPLIKRTIGLPGETIAFRNGDLYVDGEFIAEPYVADTAPPITTLPLRIPENHYFVMGDNRGNSTDSRVFGPIPDDSIIGEALFRFWPPGRAGAV